MREKMREEEEEEAAVDSLGQAKESRRGNFETDVKFWSHATRDARDRTYLRLGTG